LRALGPDDAIALAAVSESRVHDRYNPVPDGVAEAQAYIPRALSKPAAGQRHPFVLARRGRLVGVALQRHAFDVWRAHPVSLCTDERNRASTTRARLEALLASHRA
jgi:hypothetical protein